MKLGESRWEWTEENVQGKGPQICFARVLSCLKAWERLGESPASGHTMNYDSGYFCICGDGRKGSKAGLSYMACFNALQGECVHVLFLQFESILCISLGGGYIIIH